MIIKSNKISEKELIQTLDIYNYYIDNSFSNFEEEKLAFKTFRVLYRNIKSNKLPFIIAKKLNNVVGMAYVSNFREKSGYRFTFEHSIYVHPKYIKNGFGLKILKELIKHSKKNEKIKNLIAVIGGSNNVASIKIHEKCGFKYIGTIANAGFKKNKWIDSVYMQKKL